MNKTSKAGVSRGFALETYLLLFVQHDVRFKAGDAGEPFVAHGAGEVGGGVCGLVQPEVELHVKRLGAQVAAMGLQRRQEAKTAVNEDVRTESLKEVGRANDQTGRTLKLRPSKIFQSNKEQHFSRGEMVPKLISTSIGGSS